MKMSADRVFKASVCLSTLAVDYSLFNRCDCTGKCVYDAHVRHLLIPKIHAGRHVVDVMTPSYRRIIRSELVPTYPPEVAVA